MSYANLRFIGYVINTGPEVAPDNAQRYLGIDPPRADIDARCALLMRAIATAQAAIPQDSPPESGVLNVFMAPEFFFRGNQGGYAMDDVQYAIQQLQQMVSGEEWTDWMFVMGTLVGFSTSDVVDTKEVYNFALTQQGGTASSEPVGTRVVMKELKSGIDFIAGVGGGDTLLLGEVAHLPSGPQGPGQERQQTDYDGAGIFELDGVTWGLEICLDHHEEVNRLLKSPSLPGESEIQVQLVPSCGMTIRPESVVAEVGGYIFNCDGLGNGSSLAQVGLGAPPALTPIDKLCTCPLSDAPVEVPGSPPTSIAIAQLYPDGAGEIDFYPCRPVPPPSVVAGKVLPLSWRASASYTFDFQIAYDGLGRYSTVLCMIRSTKINFHDHKYYLPLNMVADDDSGASVAILMELIGGTNGYDMAVKCNIQVSDLRFEGIAFEFMGRQDTKAPLTCW